MKNRKRYHIAKFLGEQWSVVDTKRNATLGVHPNRQAAKEAAGKLNSIVAMRATMEPGRVVDAILAEES